MSFPIGVGVSDIIKALDICRWIHKNCFNPRNSASVLYREFRDDVRRLETRIKDFQASFENATEQLGRMDRTRLDMFKLESEELIGDYLKTLEACKKLLKKHAKFDGERATALDNGFWYAKSQPLVEQLRKELQAHSYKIYLFLEPVRLELVTDISADTQEILAHLRQRAGMTISKQLPEIPSSMDLALTDALSRDCPVPYDGPRNVPLRESIDALTLHYRDSTVGSTSTDIGKDEKQNLSLLKAHWLFQTIESSASFSQSRQGSLYRRVLEQLGQQIEKQYRLLKIERWHEEEFEALDDIAWAIWPVKEPLRPEVLTDKNDREEKLVETPLVCADPDEKEDLYVFRISESTLRIVKSRHLKNPSTGPQMTERFLDLDCDGLVPFYAVAPPDRGCHTLNVTNGKGGGPVSYAFPSREKALQIQTAFTGYHAISHIAGVSCTFTWRRPSWFKACDQGKGVGEVQIWRWPVSKSQSGSSPIEPSSSRRSNSFYSRSRQSSTAQQISQAFDPNIVSVTSAEAGEMMIAELPPPPALVFLVQRHSKYIMWYLELSQVEWKNLRHAKRYRSVLERPKGKTFELRRLAVNESQLDFWNIRAIAVPTHSASKDKSRPTVETLNGASVVLDFTGEQEQMDFERRFKYTAVQRMEQVDQYNLGRKLATSQSDMPTRRPSYVSPTTDGEPSSDSSSSSNYGSPITDGEPTSTSASAITSIPECVEEGPPTLDPIPRFSRLDVR